MDIGRALVEAGAHVNMAERQGGTALGQARRRGYPEMLAILGKAGRHSKTWSAPLL